MRVNGQMRGFIGPEATCPPWWTGCFVDGPDMDRRFSRRRYTLKKWLLARLGGLPRVPLVERPPDLLLTWPHQHVPRPPRGWRIARQRVGDDGRLMTAYERNRRRP